MVFGTTYCAVSHLPIQDGEKCILLPLGFNMKYDFDTYNKADVGCFMYLYDFIDEPQEVIYKGNPNMLEYLDKNYEQAKQYELFMLVHFDFYNSVQAEYMKGIVFNLSDIKNFKTLDRVYEKVKEIRDKVRADLIGKIKSDEVAALTYMTGGVAPDWIVAIYKFAMFIDGLGIIPYPNNAVDQHNRNVLYEKIRNTCIDKIKL